MIGFIAKLFGGNKSEKDIKVIQPVVARINEYFNAYQSISNDALRGKTAEFKQRIRQHLSSIDQAIATLKEDAEKLDAADMTGRDTAYQEIDKLIKDRDDKIEEILKEILPEAFAVVKETARRFKENTHMVATATELDREFSTRKDYVTIDGDKSTFKNTWTAGGGQRTAGAIAALISRCPLSVVCCPTRFTLAVSDALLLPARPALSALRVGDRAGAGAAVRAFHAE